MGIRSKLAGIGIAALLSVSGTGLVAAQDGHSFDDTIVNAELVPNVCSVSAATSDITFGPWEFDGDETYVLTGLDAKAIFWDLTVPGPGDTCDVSFSMFGHKLSSGTNEIGTENLSFSVYNLGAVGDLGTKRTVALNTNHEGAAFKLVIPNDAAPGSYAGKLRIETTNAQ